MNDLISRQVVIDAILAVTGNSTVRELYEHVQEHGLSEMWSGGVNAAIDIIIAVPSVQPEPSQVARDIATIIENEKDMRVIAHPKASLIWQPVYGWFRCGACKKVYPNALMNYFNTCEYQPKFNFCPNCGADMREEIQ